MIPKPEYIKIGMLPSIPWASRFQLPDCPAVYFALTANDELLYIGQTISLKYRWSRGAHHREQELRSAKCHRVAWLQLNPTSLYDAEQAFIRHYKPFFNKALPKNVVEIITIERRPRLTCFRCGYEWQPLSDHPRHCANIFCHSARWDDPTVEKWRVRIRGGMPVRVGSHWDY